MTEFRKINNVVKFNESKQNAKQNKTVSDLSAVVRDVPKYEKTMNVFKKHISVLDKCMKACEKQKIKELIDLENDIIKLRNNQAKLYDKENDIIIDNINC
jgi:hypothetical protein